MSKSVSCIAPDNSVKVEISGKRVTLTECKFGDVLSDTDSSQQSMDVVSIEFDSIAFEDGRYVINCILKDGSSKSFEFDLGL